MQLKLRINSFIIGLILPLMLLLKLSLLLQSEILKYITLIICILVSIFITQIYDYLFYDSSTTCAKHAGNLALKNNYSPCYPDGSFWNPDELKVSEIFENYKSACSDYPQKNTMGFVFYTNKSGTFSRHVEFYDYTKEDEKVGIYKFYFSSYPLHNKNDHVNLVYIPIKKIKKMKFYALNKIE
ncbi:hypothetical protein [Treponema sp.]|uniref:hypothetical protein n=1 Tax=Treponema sp. TaxID=166 RepID=UPI00298D635E|nr:hypothetical protein [Treponema sp.]MCR5612551.1 hypothetical protein [Treponema sp.]